MSRKPHPLGPEWAELRDALKHLGQVLRDELRPVLDWLARWLP